MGFSSSVGWLLNRHVVVTICTGVQCPRIELIGRDIPFIAFSQAKLMPAEFSQSVREATIPSCVHDRPPSLPRAAASSPVVV